MEEYTYDADGVAPIDNTLINPGNYIMAVAEYSAKDNKHMLPSFSVKCVIDEGPSMGRVIWHRVHMLPKDNAGAGIFLHFLKTLGQPWEGKFKVTPDNWVGRRFMARVGIGKDRNEEPISEIKGLQLLAEGLPPMNMQLAQKYQQKMLDNGQVPF